jgi:hypothetical protein
MKNFIILLLIAEAAGVVNGQQIDTLKKTRYAVEISQFKTGSGFSSSTEFYFTVIPDSRKNLSLGFFYSHEQKKICGVTLHHEIALSHRASKQTITPFFFYNLVYRFTHTSVQASDQTVESQAGLYKSMEHHIGLGLNARMLKSMYIKGAVGYGVYFGSIKKPVVDQMTKEVCGSNGFGGIGKLGIVYIF